mgnify:CR=1 FL=1
MYRLAVAYSGRNVGAEVTEGGDGFYADGVFVCHTDDIQTMIAHGIIKEIEDRKWTDTDMVNFARWTQFMPPQSYKAMLEPFGVEIERLRKNNWIRYRPPVDKICCRCGDNVGDNALTNFLFKIEARSLAGEKLFHCRKPNPMGTISHPAVHDATHGQLVILKGGADEPYHLCNQCHEDLLCTVGQFLDSKAVR